MVLNVTRFFGEPLIALVVYATRSCELTGWVWFHDLHSAFSDPFLPVPRFLTLQPIHCRCRHDNSLSPNHQSYQHRLYRYYVFQHPNHTSFVNGREIYKQGHKWIRVRTEAACKGRTPSAGSLTVNKENLGSTGQKRSQAKSTCGGSETPR